MTNQPIEAIEALNVSIVQAAGRDDLLGSIADSILDLLGAARVAFFLGGSPEPVLSTGFSSDELARLTEQASGSKNRAGIFRFELGRGDVPAVVVPITGEGQSIGEMIVAGRDAAPSFANQHLLLAGMLAGQLAVGLQRFAAMEEVTLWRDEARRAQDQLAAYARDIRLTFKAEKERANQLGLALEELERTYLATVQGMAAAVEAKDEYTHGHLVRVNRYGLAMVHMITGREQPERHFEEGFLLHDIGKLAIPDGILKKRGTLDAQEWEVMRSHVDIGYKILRNIPFLAEARQIVLGHHERWDGEGYPRGLEGEDIPLGARLFPVADSFDAMTSHRPYRAALSIDDALRELEAGSGSQFWPEAVEAFVSLPRDQVEEMMRATDESLLDG